MTEGGDGTPTGGASARAAWFVGAGIFLSRVAGFLREAVFAYFFGNSAVADAWRVALRTPNVIQNLLGEGTLSASFIPVYAEFLEEGREEEAGRFAGAALGILATVAFGAALLGVLLAPVLIRLLYPAWDPPKQDLTIHLVRILFPMTAVLAVSAWALGILNSHRRFFVSYVAPVVWNLAIITAMATFGVWMAFGQERLIVATAWGALVGGVLQLLVQLPSTVRLLRGFRLSVSRRVAGVKEAIANFLPVVMARGVINLSGWLDTILAGLLATGAVAMLGYAQTLYMLPVSLFGMSIAASELPELSRRREELREVLVPRVRRALGQVQFLLVPSALAYLAAGDVFTAALFQRGEFDLTDTAAVYAVLGAYALGLVASSSSRVLSSAYYAVRDTRTPARVAYLRVGVSLAVGAALMFPLDRVAVTGPGEVRRLGAAGLALGAAVGAWLEYTLLRRRLARVIGPHGTERGRALRVAGAGIVAAGATLAAKGLLGSAVPAREGWLHQAVGPDSWLLWPLAAVGTALVFGVVYLGVASVLGVGAPVRALLRRRG